MKDEKTRSKLAAGYGSSSPNPWSNWIENPARDAFRLARASAFWVGIDANNPDIGIKALAQNGESACAATNIKHPIARLQFRLIEEHPSRLVTSKQLHDWVVKR